MLRKLLHPNKCHLCHVFNLLLHYSFVQVQMKQAIVVPLLKCDKPPSDPDSYRPVSLTSCVENFFERVISSRLNWFIESRRILHNSQAGFCPKRRPTDHIVQLKIDVKQGFSKKAIYTSVKIPMSAEVILQPVLEEIGNWSYKWNFKFSGEKSAQMVFTRSQKTEPDRLLFINAKESALFSTLNSSG